MKENRIVREQMEARLATWPEDEQRQIRAEMDAELSEARRKLDENYLSSSTSNDRNEIHAAARE